MAELLFQTSEIDSRFAGDNEGTAFQQFVFEVIESELPHLHPYPASGKDGGIDHLTDEPEKPRVAVDVNSAERTVLMKFENAGV